MRQIILSLTILSGLSLIACKQSVKKNNETKKIEFDQGLADELKSMTEIDQIAASFPQGEYKQLTQRQWEKFQDSVFTTIPVRTIFKLPLK